ncbi:helix-turn-helix domain-containing protein [Ramlibacter alkalitolerans]|uniref:helix-turn-helix domain-containing protein n=1 Tax=Ramlibacter alkalitolerans TaxID=2039631 RepID=UPI001F2A0C51|nr:helix-turn-helix domain-containing protein [Ramlibacter alkalitolerans]
MNVAAVLKTEMSRIARKELRAETEGLKKAVAGYRHEIAALKRDVAGLQRQLKVQARHVAKVQPAEPAPAEDGRQLRWSPERFAKQRQKLELSAADFAKLLGVSSLSVYKWEHGQARPRQRQLEAIAAARKLGKREARAKLEELAG